MIDKVAHVNLARPDKANAINREMWFELEQAFRWADETAEVRCAVLAAEGGNFSAGIDWSLLEQTLGEIQTLPDGRKQETLRRRIMVRTFSIKLESFASGSALSAGGWFLPSHAFGGAI